MPEAAKTEVTKAAEELVEAILKSQYVKPPPKDEQFNYIVDICTKRSGRPPRLHFRTERARFPALSSSAHRPSSHLRLRVGDPRPGAVQVLAPMTVYLMVTGRVKECKIEKRIVVVNAIPSTSSGQALVMHFHHVTVYET